MLEGGSTGGATIFAAVLVFALSTKGLLGGWERLEALGVNSETGTRFSGNVATLDSLVGGKTGAEAPVPRVGCRVASGSEGLLPGGNTGLGLLVPGSTGVTVPLVEYPEAGAGIGFCRPMVDGADPNDGVVEGRGMVDAPFGVAGINVGGPNGIIEAPEVVPGVVATLQTPFGQLAMVVAGTAAGIVYTGVPVPGTAEVMGTEVKGAVAGIKAVADTTPLAGAMVPGAVAFQ